MYVEYIEWDDDGDELGNLHHATAHGISAAEIEQAVMNAGSWRRHRTRPERRLIRSETNGGRKFLVIVDVVRHGIRPVTSWEVDR